MSKIKLLHAKLHRVYVTEANRDYVGSIAIDRDLLEKVGILPLEEVKIANLSNGNRWTTYVLPGDSGAGQICPNGGGALLCQPGDILIIWADEERERTEVLKTGHQARVVISDEHNRCQEFFYQMLIPHQGGVEFCSYQSDTTQLPSAELSPIFSETMSSEKTPAVK